MWRDILKNIYGSGYIYDELVESYNTLNYEYFVVSKFGSSRPTHHFVFYLTMNELGDLIMDILEENERRNTIARFDIDGFRVAMQNPAMHTLVNFFSHIIFQLSYDEIEKLVENNNDLMLAELTNYDGNNTGYKFEVGSPELYRNVTIEVRKRMKKIYEDRY